ncbi:MAG: CDP-archaeol synthase [Flavobacteriia bacterium]|nr:CDP-archaeol synthase [Flavobacteriia bacterium]OIP48338.1 MAG: phosphatidate cytidylyltransferase [Flavobacteriaceae bacterium CG2_30_31_66]PIV96285.1 MAG: phosphatidate cytidylyltransferase [Flavobacteriaceae bacterium CG17_big_fil_post_rev_8_21_14_2_50_31_13]PIX12678.1 MAG: phosphatidate cytidylyltransferase [Flavobacteriaceae bacterium CG_4_8_14_3_um_filter_31_8]PIY13545.1 MAG: phosphatidate cytidylyltransferase [Flavobacteriaceae bacterium CG_4_10_14_3_um_filter_31_253]PIZ09422.1 MAG: 
MSSLFRRSFSGIIYILIFLSAILFSQESYIILISLFGFLCLWEFSKIVQLKPFAPYVFFAVTLFLMVKSQESFAVIVILCITLTSSFFFIYKLFSKKLILYNTERAKLGITIRYVIFSFCFLVLLPFSDNQFHPFLMISILSIIWVNDSFAFFVGKNIGKRKLFPSVSPNKTVEGFVGGLIFSIIAALVISNMYPHFSMIQWIVIAFIVSIFGTIGDLIVSKFKRQANLKDSGKLMPGHGGILDRLDSLLFASPFVYLYINIII